MFYVLYKSTFKSASGTVQYCGLRVDYPIKKKSLSCTIILPWVKYTYKRLPIEVCNYPDVFQGIMNKLFQGFEYIRVYLDDLLFFTTVDWTNY